MATVNQAYGVEHADILQGDKLADIRTRLQETLEKSFAFDKFKSNAQVAIPFQGVAQNQTHGLFVALKSFFINRLKSPSARSLPCEQLVACIHGVQRELLMISIDTGGGKTAIILIVLEYWRIHEGKGGFVLIVSPIVALNQQHFEKIKEVFGAEAVVVLDGSTTEKERQCQGPWLNLECISVKPLSHMNRLKND